MIAYPLVLIARARHPKSDVEALTSGIVSAFVIRVRVAEAVVARGQEGWFNTLNLEILLLHQCLQSTHNRNSKTTNNNKHK